MTRVRIVHVIESAAGGSFRYVAEVCRSLDPELWSVTVVFSRRPETPENFKAEFPNYVNFYEIEMQRELSPMADFRAVGALRKVLKNAKPHIIHLHSSKAGAIGRLASIGLSCRVVYTPHGYAFFRQDISPLKRFVFCALEFILAVVNRGYVLVGSKSEYRWALRLSGAKRVFFILNSIRVPHHPAANPSQNTTLATVGRVSAAKNPNLILDILDCVMKRVPSVQFVWIGDGEERAELTKESQERNLPIQVTGWLSHEEVFKMLKNVRVYIQASKWEALPLALIEAMAQARPVVASNIQAHRDILTHSVNGYLADTPESYAQYIIPLLLDDALAKTVGIAAWETVHNGYNLEQFSAMVTGVYQAILNKFKIG